MRTDRKAGLVLLLALLFGVTFEAQAQVGNCEPAQGEAFLDINNVRARIFNNGNLFWRGSPHVYEVPKGGGANAIFASGIWLGGQVGGQLRAAAARYGNYNFWAGPLDDNGAPPADCSAFDRLWKVSRNDIDNYEATGLAARDLRDWPTGLGAPTFAPAETDGVDNNDDGEVDEPGEMKRVDQELLQLPLAQRVNRTIDLAAGERPAILGDQSIWWIMNDRGNQHLAPSADTPPIGVEVHGMAFAFNTSGAIGNTTFYKYNIFYKGDVPLEKAYIGIFSDPDLGNFDDDYVGSDTTLGLGYTYNADNNDEGGEGYGEAPPAVGYDFFQGPIVPSPGDTAQVSGVKVPGFKNLKMTHFVFYNNGGGVTEDPQNGSDYYNYLQGRWKDGKQITFGGKGRDFSNIPVDFMFPGDPVTGTGWTEFDPAADGGSLPPLPPADRRFAMSSGPFTINPDDQQEIVFGIVWARGNSNINSVAELRKADALAQAAFDVNFELPAPPAAPIVTATGIDNAVILEWDNLPRSNNYLEGYSAFDPFAPPENPNYDFEGYIVYQFDNPQDQVGKPIATFDIKNGVTRVIDGIPGEPTFVAASGTDSGIQHSLVVPSLTNYKTYYFGVQAYAYNEPSAPKVYLGPIARVEAVPTRTTNREGGTVLSAVVGDEASVQRPAGQRTESVIVEVVNPNAVTGNDYRIEIIDVNGITSFNIVNAATGEVKFDGDAYVRRNGRTPVTSTLETRAEQAIVVDGLNFRVFAATDCFDGVFHDDEGTWDFGRGRPIQREFIARLAGDRPYPEEGTVIRFYSDPLELTGDFDGDGVSDTTRAVTEVAGPGGANPCADGAANCINGERVVDFPFASSNGEWSLPVLTTQSFGNLPNYTPNTYEVRFTDGEGDEDLAWNVFTSETLLRVPYEVWDIGPVAPGQPNDPSDDVRMVAAQFADDGNECEFGYTDIGVGIPVSDRIYAYYPVENDFAEAQQAMLSHLAYPLQPGDIFTVSTGNLAAVKGQGGQVDLDIIGIVPNPYKGTSEYEVSQLVDEVRFTNLPDVATIRVFTLNGTLIRTIEKNSPGRAWLPWNLTTDDGLPIASGMYLIHVEVPGVGEKVIKFGVVKKRIQLNTF